MNLNEIVDKKLHLIVGFFLGYLLNGNALLAILAVIIVATAKEIYNATHDNTYTPEIMDSLHTVLCGVVGVLIGQLIGALT